MNINKNLFRVVKQKAYTAGDSYPDLHLFKEQTQIHTVNNKPYSLYKRKINTYRLTFLGIALFYLVFAAIFFYTLSPYMTSFLLGSYSYLLKNAICAGCVLAAVSFIGLSFTLSAEKEAVHFIHRRCKSKLKTTYSRNLAKAGLKRFFLFGEKRQHLINYNQIYHDSIDKLYHFKDDTFHLIEKIMASDNLDYAKKEHLLNQALLEMNDRMNEAVHRFKFSEHIKMLNSL